VIQTGMKLGNIMVKKTNKNEHGEQQQNTKEQKEGNTQNDDNERAQTPNQVKRKRKGTQ
jgi:hypothetical protein